MASLITGYEYDIFISYRQKDNRGDRWVSEFVDALESELESTLKEEVSVYFDINPHNGLLETHDVDASLKDKLKCLIFIPVISRTYCDPKSFAWEHEFKAFVKLASQDQFGLKVKLPNGNVASRVLPIRIHDLDNVDKTLLERELGGVLRSIEFIYREPGVNRPLTPTDDEKKNLNKTRYLNQINKLANAIEEIIQSLKKVSSAPLAEKLQHVLPLSEIKREDEKKVLVKEKILSLKSKWLMISLMLILCVVGAFAIFKIIDSKRQAHDLSKLEKSIAVLPFINDSPDEENTYFINGIMDEILNNLQKIKDFRVLSRTSTEQYRGKSILTIPEIAKKLDVNYIIEGSGQKYGNTFRLRIQLIAANNEKHLWGESFEQEIQNTKDIFKIQSQIAQTIAEELKTTITPEEKQLIEKTATTNLTAYDFYQKGNEELSKYFYEGNNQSLNRAEELFSKALKYDSTFARAYTGLAGIYFEKHNNEYKSYFTNKYLDSVLILSDHAISYDNHLSEGYYFRALYYINYGKTEQAIEEFDKAIKYNPNNWEAYVGKVKYVYLSDLNYSDYVKALEYFQIGVSINRGEKLPSLLYFLGNIYGYYAGFPEEAKKYYQEAFKLDGDTSTYLDYTGSLEIQYGDFEKGIEKSLKAYAKDSDNWRLAGQYYCHGQYKESLKYFKKYIERLKSSGKFPFGNLSLIGYAYWKNGYKKEAEYWFNEQKRARQESFELGRKNSSIYGFGSSNTAYYDLAGVYAFMGEKEKAFENLRIFARKSIFPLLTVDFIKKYDPLFNSIRNETEFQKIVKDMETKYQAEHERVRKWMEEKGKR
jgi:TolB-like protein/Tfp pilus assembly protein PilF